MDIFCVQQALQQKLPCGDCGVAVDGSHHSWEKVKRIYVLRGRVCCDIAKDSRQ
jgi:hypothetical protein